MTKASAIIYENLDTHMLDKSAYLLKALCHPLRMKIISYIDKNKIVPVNKIYNTLNLEQSITSQHLNILRTAKIVNTKREGKFIYYSLNYPIILRINDLVLKYNIR